MLGDYDRAALSYLLDAALFYNRRVALDLEFKR